MVQILTHRLFHLLSLSYNLLLRYLWVDIGYGSYLPCCPKRDWLAGFEKLGGGLVQMGDNSTCKMDVVGTILIKIFDGMVREM